MALTLRTRTGAGSGSARQTRRRLTSRLVRTRQLTTVGSAAIVHRRRRIGRSFGDREAHHTMRRIVRVSARPLFVIAMFAVLSGFHRVSRHVARLRAACHSGRAHYHHAEATASSTRSCVLLTAIVDNPQLPERRAPARSRTSSLLARVAALPLDAADRRPARRALDRMPAVARPALVGAAGASRRAECLPGGCRGRRGRH